MPGPLGHQEQGLEVNQPLTRRVAGPLHHMVVLLFAPMELMLTLQQKKRLLAKRKASSKNTIFRVGTAKEIILTWQGEGEKSRDASTLLAISKSSII